MVGNVPWVGSFLRKARNILVGTYERTKRYQSEFEKQSHTLYNQHRNKIHLLKECLDSEFYRNQISQQHPDRSADMHFENDLSVPQVIIEDKSNSLLVRRVSMAKQNSSINNRHDSNPLASRNTVPNEIVNSNMNELQLGLYRSLEQ